MKQNINKRAQKYLQENDLLLRKYKLILRLVINFSNKKKVPFLSKIALWIITKQGGQLDIQFNDIKQT